MFADDDSAQRQFDERLDREGGVFAESDAKEVACDSEAEPCAPDDYANDSEARENGVPGTVDDAPLSFGLDSSAAADQHVVLEGATKPAGDSKEAADTADDLGSTDEKELWAEQQTLVEEDDIGGLKLKGFPEEEIPEILDAMGDDAADPLQDFPNGTSATGDWSAPEHGGFPVREK
jgi:hypothetical protein